MGYVWQMQPNQRHRGPWLPGSGVMDLESAQIAGENDPDCIGFSFRSEFGGSRPSGRVPIWLFAAKGNPRALERQRAASSSTAPPFGNGEDGADEEFMWT